MAIEFAIDLKDGVSAPAGSAAHQVDVLQKQMRGLADQMVKSNALGDAKAFNKASDQFTKLSAKVAELGPAAKSETDQLKAAMTSTSDAVEGATNETEGFGQAMNAVGPEVKAVAVAVTAAIAAVVGFAAAVYKGIQAVTKLTETRRTLEATLSALEGVDNRGGGVVKMLDDMAQKLPFTTAEMGEWSKSMMLAGVRDLPTLANATKAAAASAAILGDATGAAGMKVADLHVQFANAIRLRSGIGDLRGALTGTGLSIDEVASSLKITTKQLEAMAASGQKLNVIGAAIDEALIKKGGKALGNMALTWDVMTKKAHESFANLFKGVSDSPGFKAFLQALSSLLSVFGQNTGAGKAMASGVVGAFDRIFAVASKVITWMHVKILELATVGVRWYISMFPVLKTLVAIWTQAKGFEKLKTALDGVWFVISAIGKGVWNLIRPFIFIAGVLVAIGGVLAWLVGAFTNFWTKVKAKLDEWKDAAKTAAANFISGLVDGIKNGAKWVLDAVKGLGTGALDAFKGVLGIKSPSKVMMQMGGHMTAGLTQGLERGTSDVEDAATGLGVAGASGVGSGASGSSSSSKASIVVEAGAIQVVAAPGQSAGEIAEEVLALLLERIALSRGLGAPT